MSASDVERVALAHQIASALEGSWSAEPGNWHDDVFLKGPDDEHLHLRFGGFGAQARGRLFVSGSLSNELYQFKPYDFKNPAITVSETKSADQIARDIERRLLPDFRVLLANVRERKAASDRAEAERDELLTLLLAALGPGSERWSRMGRDELRVGAYGDQIHGDVEVLHGNEAKFMIRTASREACLALAVAIAAVRGKAGQ